MLVEILLKLQGFDIALDAKVGISDKNEGVDYKLRLVDMLVALAWINELEQPYSLLTENAALSDKRQFIVFMNCIASDVIIRTNLGLLPKSAFDIEINQK